MPNNNLIAVSSSWCTHRELANEKASTRATQELVAYIIIQNPGYVMMTQREREREEGRRRREWERGSWRRVHVYRNGFKL